MKLLLISILVLATSLSLANATVCSRHGYLYAGKCYCFVHYSGRDCENDDFHQIYDTDTDCDDAVSRLDYLFNISPNFYHGDDPAFSRKDPKTLGKGSGIYGEKGNMWTRMHDVASDFKIFGTNGKNGIHATDVNQGAIGNCYLLAALASLVHLNNGEYIKDMFLTKEDNDKHVYVTRWLVDGKPRYVAVDEWIPARNKHTPSMSKVPEDHDFWAIILEKAWSKIHGSYMSTQYGWATTVWRAITQAPTTQIWHTRVTKESIHTLLFDLKKKQYAIGCDTYYGSKVMVGGHAYGVLGVYSVTKRDGSKITLVQAYNPWGVEKWDNNPWADDSSNWTDDMKRQVNFAVKNDGAFYVSFDDYYKYFRGTFYSENHPGYTAQTQDVPTTKSKTRYTATFSYSRGNSRCFYVNVDTVDDRFWHGKKHCKTPFSVIYVKVTKPDGSSEKKHYGEAVKIESAADGTYTLEAEIEVKTDYHNMFTFTLYAPKKTVTWTKRTDTDQLKIKGRDCPNGCSRQGICNRFSGQCKCYEGYTGNDCNGGDNDNNDNNKGCQDQRKSCNYWKGQGYCSSSSEYHNYAAKYCPKACNTCNDNNDNNDNKQNKCDNVDADCRNYAEDGLCNGSNGWKEWMAQNCKEACIHC